MRARDVVGTAAGALALAVVLFVLPSCGGVNPPPADCRTLGCEPGFECREVDGAWKCVAVEAFPPISMLLRRDGPQLTDLNGDPVEFIGEIPCCKPLEDLEGFEAAVLDQIPTPAAIVVEGVEINTGWPVAVSPGWQDFVHANVGDKIVAYHARLGPFFEGIETQWSVGPYIKPGKRADLTRFNPVFWDTTFDWSLAAALRGDYVEIDVNDRWWAKQRTTPNPMRPEWNLQGYDWASQVGKVEIKAGSHIDKWLRQIVCRPDNPEKALGRLPNIIFQDGNEVGLGGYDPIWSRSMRDRIRVHEASCGAPTHMFGTNSSNAGAERTVDYIERHTNSAPLLKPLHNRPSMVNEYNPRPSLTATQLHRNFCAAKKAGTIYWHWRHGQDQATLVATMKLLAKGCADVPPPPPPPPPPQNRPCTPEGGLVAMPDDNRPAMYHGQVLKATRKLGDMTGMSEDRALAAVAKEVRKLIGQCVIAGGEAIFMIRPDKTWEENHTVAADAAPNHNAGWTNNGRGRYIGVHSSAPMPDGLLPDPRGYDDHADYALVKWQGKWDRTLTLKRVLPYCEAIGMGEMGGLPRASCPVRPEGNDFRFWWEELYGYYWECDGVEIEPTSNPAQAHCQGRVKTCDAAQTICSEADW